MSERDPRVEPVTGDVLRRWHAGACEVNPSLRRNGIDDVFRKVLSVSETEIVYELTIGGQTWAEVSDNPNGWRKWAANAEVVKRGDA